MTDKRKKVQEYILKHVGAMDPEGTNVKYYTDLFKKLSDAEFDTWMKNIKAGKDVLKFYSANVTNKLTVRTLADAAKDLGIELFERIRMWDEATQTYYLTPNKYFVVPMHVRRMSQFVDHKLSVAEGDHRIDLMSGQPVKPDQAGSISQVEIQTLFSRGLTNTILELIKYRGGDVVAFAEYKRELEEQGRTTVARNTGSVVRSAVIFDVLMSGVHIESNASGV